MWPFGRKEPRSTAQKLRAGAQALARGDYPAAVQWLGEVVAARPEDVGALLGLGTAYHHLEQHSRAIELFERVTSLQPNNAEAWLGMAAARTSLGHLVKAEEALSKIVAIDAHFPDVHYNLAVVKLRLGRALEALAELELQMADSPGHADARELLTKLRAQVTQ